MAQYHYFEEKQILLREDKTLLRKAQILLSEAKFLNNLMIIFFIHLIKQVMSASPSILVAIKCQFYKNSTCARQFTIYRESNATMQNIGGEILNALQTREKLVNTELEKYIFSIGETLPTTDQLLREFVNPGSNVVTIKIEKSATTGNFTRVIGRANNVLESKIETLAKDMSNSAARALKERLDAKLVAVSHSRFIAINGLHAKHFQNMLRGERNPEEERKIGGVLKALQTQLGGNMLNMNRFGMFPHIGGLTCSIVAEVQNEILFFDQLPHGSILGRHANITTILSLDDSVSVRPSNMNITYCAASDLEFFSACSGKGSPENRREFIAITNIAVIGEGADNWLHNQQLMALHQQYRMSDLPEALKNSVSIYISPVGFLATTKAKGAKNVTMAVQWRAVVEVIGLESRAETSLQGLRRVFGQSEVPMKKGVEAHVSDTALIMTSDVGSLVMAFNQKGYLAVQPPEASIKGVLEILTLRANSAIHSVKSAAAIALEAKINVDTVIGFSALPALNRLSTLISGDKHEVDIFRITNTGMVAVEDQTVENLLRVPPSVVRYNDGIRDIDKMGSSYRMVLLGKHPGSGISDQETAADSAADGGQDAGADQGERPVDSELQRGGNIYNFNMPHSAALLNPWTQRPAAGNLQRPGADTLTGRSPSPTRSGRNGLSSTGGGGAESVSKKRALGEKVNDADGDKDDLSMFEESRRLVASFRLRIQELVNGMTTSDSTVDPSLAMNEAAGDARGPEALESACKQIRQEMKMNASLVKQEFRAVAISMTTNILGSLDAKIMELAFARAVVDDDEDI
jgi:hypothetical protein